MSAGGGGKSPDYLEAAKQTGADAERLARLQNEWSKINQVGPTGSFTWSDDGQTLTQSLTPEQRQLFEQQQANQSLALDGSQGLLQALGDRQGLNFSGLPAVGSGALDSSRLAANPLEGQAVQDAVLSRLAPQLERNRESLRARLVNQGFDENSEAFRRAMETQSQSENDLYTQAALQGIDTQLRARQQGVGEQVTEFGQGLQARQQGTAEQQAQFQSLLQQLAAMDGGEVAMPQQLSTPQAAISQPTDYLNSAIAQGQWDSAQAATRAGSQNALVAGVATIASALI